MDTVMVLDAVMDPEIGFVLEIQYIQFCWF
jgi:hypothetical protein